MPTWKETETRYVLRSYWENTSDMKGLYDDAHEVYHSDAYGMPGENALNDLDNQNHNGYDKGQNGRLYRVTVEKTITMHPNDFISDTREIRQWPEPKITLDNIKDMAGPDDREQYRMDSYYPNAIVYDEKEM